MAQSDLQERAQRMRKSGHTDSSIRAYLLHHGMNEFQAESIITNLSTHVQTETEPRHVRRIRRLVGTGGLLLTLGSLGALRQPDAGIGGLLLILAIGIMMLLFSFGVLDRWL